MKPLVQQDTEWIFKPPSSPPPPHNDCVFGFLWDPVTSNILIQIHFNEHRKIESIHGSLFTRVVQKNHIQYLITYLSNFTLNISSYTHKGLRKIEGSK